MRIGNSGIQAEQAWLRDRWDFLDWCIIGGESTQGGQCRRFDLQWGRDLMDDCRNLGIATSTVSGVTMISPLSRQMC